MKFTCEFCEIKDLPIDQANFHVFNPLAGADITVCDECRKVLEQYQR